MPDYHYDFDTVYDRDPLRRGTGKYRIMKDSKGNPPPKGTIPLSVADMEFRTAPEIIEAIQEEAAFGLLGYHRITDSFREACGQWMQTRHNWSIQPEWIVPIEQVVPALYVAIWAFTQPGDGVLVQSPAYHHFVAAPNNTGRRVITNELIQVDGRWEIDFEDFEEKARQAKLFFLCSPQNPTGRVWTPEELRRMGEICNRNHVLVVADEIHHDLIMPGHTHTVYASLGEEFAHNAIVCTSLSKSFNLAGLCYASILIPDDTLRAAFQKQQTLQAFLHINRFGPVAHEAAYRRGGPWLDEVIQYIAENYRFLKDWFAEKFPQVAVAELEGTYLVWCDFRSFGLSDRELKDFLTDECLLYLDNGLEFGQAGSGFQRFNIACPRSVLSGALDRLYAGAVKRGLTK